MLRSATNSNMIYNRVLSGNQPVVAHLARIENKWFAVFYTASERLTALLGPLLAPIS